MKFIKMYQDRYELWAYPRVAQGFCWILLCPSAGVITTGWSDQISDIDEFAEDSLRDYLLGTWFNTSEESTLAKIFSLGRVGLVENHDGQLDGFSAFAQYIDRDGEVVFHDWFEDIESAQQAVEAAHASFLGTPT